MTGVVLAYCARGYHRLCGGTRCACPCHRVTLHDQEPADE